MSRRLRVCFVSLTVLDPLAAFLLRRRRRAGGLAVVVLVTVAFVNVLANCAFAPQRRVTAGRLGQAVITLHAFGSLVAFPPPWRAAARDSSGAAELVGPENVWRIPCVLGPRTPRRRYLPCLSGTFQNWPILRDATCDLE